MMIFTVAVRNIPRINDIGFGSISMYDITVVSLNDTVMTAYIYLIHSSSFQLLNVGVMLSRHGRAHQS